MVSREIPFIYDPLDSVWVLVIWAQEFDLIKIKQSSLVEPYWFFLFILLL